MRRTRFQTRLDDERGFTLIELLVSVALVGILAAIALPSFLGQSKKANDSDAKTHAYAAHFAIEELSMTLNTYDVTEADLKAHQPSLNATGSLAVIGAPRTYTLTVKSHSGTKFSISRLPGGAIKRTCTPVGFGCPDGGEW